MHNLPSREENLGTPIENWGKWASWVIDKKFNFTRICKFVPNIIWRRFKTLKKKFLSLKNLLRFIRAGLTSIFNSQIKIRPYDSRKFSILFWNGTQIILFGICKLLKIHIPENEYVFVKKIITFHKTWFNKPNE